MHIFKILLGFSGSCAGSTGLADITDILLFFLLFIGACVTITFVAKAKALTH